MVSVRQTFTNLSSVLLTILRILIGWHFLYEGIAKLWTPGWSAASYLDLSRWIFAPFFHWLASHGIALTAVNLLNIFGLILIGLALMIGAYIRIASLAGAGLLLLYYFANPPLIGMDFGAPVEGHYLIVNKNLVELSALLVLTVLPAGATWGIDTLRKMRKPREFKPDDQAPETAGRREIIKSLISLPFLGAFTAAVIKKSVWESQEEKNLVDVVTSASVKSFDFSTLKDLKGSVPTAKIAGVDFSRMILGGNLIGGWAHARDLIYVSNLVKAYHHRDKIFETLLLAEKCGINALLTNPLLIGVVKEYWRRNIGQIKFISDCGGTDLLERIRMSIDAGSAACYVQGEVADRLVREGNYDLIAKAIQLIRDNGLPAGIGGHYLATITGCVARGFEPDFWMKTFHHLNYWSANLPTEQDNVFCREPEETIAVMSSLKQPFIAFKTLAAGAITPEDGFKYAFENGADFICVGMYDFQIVDDVNIMLSVLNGELKRERPWRA